MSGFDLCVTVLEKRFEDLSLPDDNWARICTAGVIEELARQVSVADHPRQYVHDLAMEAAEYPATPRPYGQILPNGCISLYADREVNDV